MNVKQTILKFRTKLDTAIKKQEQRCQIALQLKTTELKKQKSELKKRHESTLNLLEISLNKKEISQKFLENQKLVMLQESKDLEAHAVEIIDQQKKQNIKISKQFEKTARENITTGIFNNLVKECVGSSNLIKKSFQGIPMHIQRFNLRVATPNQRIQPKYPRRPKNRPKQVP